jgi:hypothetical protein
MHTCEQTKGQTVFQHGESVWEYTQDLLQPIQTKEWKLPDWFHQFGDQLRSSLHPIDIIEKYTRYHDIGKPLCRTVDPDGRVHFPNHADVSREAYLQATGDLITANLIGWDMCIHSEKSEEIALRLNGGYFAGADKGWEKGYRPWTKQDACTLLIAALAELHSNARLFGGTSSTSFKIKFKQIDKRGKQICKFYFGDSNE